MGNTEIGDVHVVDLELINELLYFDFNILIIFWLV